jgi:dihydroceramide fatty acyl 2-hydroxylase
MAHPPIDHSDIPIRLFKSDFLEFFSHISPVAIVIIWVPVVIFFLVRAILQAPIGAFPWYIPAGFVIGLFLWTLSEYLLHRFVFHFPPKTPRMERITFLFHGVHHAQPQCKTRLVMPPVIFGLPQWVGPTFAGFLVGYLIYDLMHYATHHFPMRSGYLKYIKRYHMQHHYKTPNARFGVSSPLWDMVFKTMPAEGK